eukprot:4696779-Pyramimonas_sp.AAC.1
MASAAVGLVLPPKQQCHYQNKWSYSNTPKHILRNAHPDSDEITCIKFSFDNQTMLTRCADHTLKVRDMRKSKSPMWDMQEVEVAHDCTVTALCPVPQVWDMRKLKSPVTVWDMRKLKSPVKVFDDLYNNYSQTQIAFSPDETLFFTGTSAQRDGTKGALVFFEKHSLQMVKKVREDRNAS